MGGAIMILSLDGLADNYYIILMEFPSLLLSLPDESNPNSPFDGGSHCDSIA